MNRHRREYVLTPAAAQDIVDIREYIRPRSPQGWQSLRRQLHAAMRSLAKFPLTGHTREELADKAVRFWNVGSYIVVYVPDSEPLRVIRVLHGARDFQRLL